MACVQTKTTSFCHPIPVHVPPPIVDEHHEVIRLASAELSDGQALKIMQGLDWIG